MKLFRTISIIIFVTFLFNCSGNTGKDLFKKAKQQIKSKNYSEAMVSFKNIVEKYPKTEEAGKSLFEIANLYKGNVLKDYSKAMVTFKKVVKQFPKSEEARKSLFEIANLYQGKVLKNISSEESLKNAVKYYKKIFDNFPDSKDASKALFMAGFTAANDLKNYDEAKKLYNLYLEKFPDGKLVTDAKIELSNLGKSPEEILKGKIKENKNE